MAQNPDGCSSIVVDVVQLRLLHGLHEVFLGSSQKAPYSLSLGLQPPFDPLTDNSLECEMPQVAPTLRPSLLQLYRLAQLPLLKKARCTQHLSKRGPF